jgi:hypothetical protein
MSALNFTVDGRARLSAPANLSGSSAGRRRSRIAFVGTRSQLRRLPDELHPYFVNQMVAVPRPAEDRRALPFQIYA